MKSIKQKTMQFLTKRNIIIGAIIIVIIIFVSLININKVEEKTETNLIKEVETKIVSEYNYDSQTIEVAGSVNAETTVDIVATAKGTARGIFFEVGDEVFINKLLVTLYDNTTLTSLNNAQTNLLNTKSNRDATVRILEENVLQAEVGVQSAEENINAAEIGFQTAQNNLNNATALKLKNNEDLKKNSVVAFGGHLNTIFSVLEQVDGIIKADEKNIIGNANPTPPYIGAQDPQTLTTAKALYLLVKKSYDALSVMSVNPENITLAMDEMSRTLDTTKELLDATITTLNKTVSNIDFSDAALSSSKASFVTLRATVVSAQSSAKGTLQALQNIDLVYTSDTDALESAVKAASNRLDSARIGLENALIVLENSKKNLGQQTISIDSAVDNARGQLNLAQNQTSNLYIKAPISGIITKKMIEMGADINPGQKIAEIQQAEKIKINVNLSSEDIYRIEKGQSVKVGEEFEGIISSINPAADPITKKVKVEILVDNKEGKLIPGTFINVIIPVKKLVKTSENSFYVPLKAVSITQNESIVFVAESITGTSTVKQVAKKRDIKTGKTEGEMIEIIEGLEGHDALIIEGAKNLEDNEEIIVK